MTREAVLLALSMPLNQRQKEMLVGFIYDDFESQTCATCKFHDERDNFCVELNKYAMKFCDKWEKKHDSTHIGLDGKETTKWGM